MHGNLHLTMVIFSITNFLKEISKNSINLFKSYELFILGIRRFCEKNSPLTKTKKRTNCLILTSRNESKTVSQTLDLRLFCKGTFSIQITWIDLFHSFNNILGLVLIESEIKKRATPDLIKQRVCIVWRVSHFAVK